MSFLFAALLPVAQAAEPPPPPGGPPPKTGGNQTPEDDDLSPTPYTQYGEFSEEDEEETETRFLKYGRLYGVSVGSGFQSVSGNRGVLWQGGFPTIDFKLHYWFDFNFAMDLNIFLVSHQYDTTAFVGGSNVAVTYRRFGGDFKYYLDTKDLSAAISFSNPYIVGGAGIYTKTETDNTSSITDTPDTSIAISAGAGFEFALKPKKSYFTIEGKVHFPEFKDTGSNKFRNTVQIPDLRGQFYTLTVSFLSTW